MKHKCAMKIEGDKKENEKILAKGKRSAEASDNG